MAIWDLDTSLDTPESFPYFRAYLEARKGTRKLAVIRHSVWNRGARQTAPTWSELNGWFLRGQWEQRAMAYDASLAQVHDEERAILERQTAEEDALRIRGMLNLLTAYTESELEKVVGESTAVQDPVPLPKGLVQAVDSAIKNRRLTNGQVTERIASYDGLSETELETIIALEEKAMRSREGK